MNGARHTFADNRSVTIAEAVSAFAVYDHRHPLAIATGYFNPGGFAAIAGSLENAPKVRILIGAEPEPIEFADRLERDGRDASARVRALETGLAAGRDLLPFARVTDEELRRLLAFLARDTTEVRIYRARFLHGKAFIFGHDAAAIAGSANFTRAGLLSNYELDLGHFDPDKVAKVSQWFEELWSEAEPFDLASIYRARFADFEPYRIYLRMLYEYYGTETEAEGEAARILGTLRLAEFQRLGSMRAQRILDEWGGALIADGVGLGKTYVAGDIIEKYAKDQGEHVLVVCPAALRSMWERFGFKHNLPLNVVSYAQLAADRVVGEGDNDALKGLAPKYYRLIVADEAHILRSPDTGYYRAMRKLMQLSPGARLLMLTATPVNNSILDLYQEILLFARNDAYFAKIGIASLSELFSRAAHLPIEDLDPSLLFPLLDAVAVRRPRAFILSQFPNATLEGPNGPVPIVFPTPRLQRIGYDLDSLQPGLFERAAQAIETGLTLARYRSLAYARDAKEFENDATRQEILSGLLRSQMLKRFESSIEAFRATCRKIAEATRRLGTFIRERHLVPIERFDPFALNPDTLGDEASDGEAFAPAASFDTDRLLYDLEADAALLDAMVAEIGVIRPEDDPKLEALVAILADAGRAAGDARKTLVFTAFGDTLDYIEAFLNEKAGADPNLAYLLGRMAFGTRNLSADERVDLAVGFAPHSMRPDDGAAEDRYDLLISTDVLSEGQNLQQCGRIVNYDLPWNPMRIAQRNGRVDRIGSPHKTVTIACFFPDQELDRLLGLEHRLLLKIAHANAAVGAGAILPGIAEIEHAFADDEAAIRKIYGEDASVIDSLEVDDAYLGEVFREELRKALLHEAREQYERLPWGAGSGFVAEGGATRVVYLARLGAGKSRRSELMIYTVPDTVTEDRLRALRTAQCQPNTPRHYPEMLRDIAIDGWERVRTALLARYQEERDPRTRQTRVSKAQRTAIALLQREGSAEAFAAAETLTVPWPVDVQRRLRAILDDPGMADSAKVRVLVEFVAERGLTAPSPDEAPAIEAADIHLICYQIVSA